MMHRVTELAADAVHQPLAWVAGGITSITGTTISLVAQDPPIPFMAQLGVAGAVVVAVGYMLARSDRLQDKARAEQAELTKALMEAKDKQIAQLAEQLRIAQRGDRRWNGKSDE